MAEYLHDPRTGQVYEKVARSGEFVWVRRMEDGVLDTLPRRQLEPYAPTPQVGELWLDGEQEVVVVGETPGGQTLAVEVPVDPAAEAVELAFYAAGEITPKPKTPRPRAADRPAIDPPPEPEPEPDLLAEAREERQR